MTIHSEIWRSRVRGFAAIIFGYPETMRTKHRTIAFRAFASANSLKYEDVMEYVRELEKESEAIG